MYLLGATLTKFFALVAAAMTVTAGMPSIECRCPDGQVKLLCLGTACTACCCSSSVNGRSCYCCQAGKHSCNARAPRSPIQGGSNSQATIKAPGCARTLVSGTTILSVANSGDSPEPVGESLTLWELIPTPFTFASDWVSPHTSPGLAVAPPNLPILFCHLAC